MKIIIFTNWLEHVVKHCLAKSLKTVLKLMIFLNIIGLSMLRIITVAVFAILVEFRLYVAFAGIFSDTLSQHLVDFFVGWQQLGLFLGKETRQVVCLSIGCSADTVEKKKHGRIRGGHCCDFEQYLKFIQPSSMPVFCTWGAHSLFIAPAYGLALSSTRPSACAVASTKLHMFV